MQYSTHMAAYLITTLAQSPCDSLLDPNLWNNDTTILIKCSTNENS